MLRILSAILIPSAALLAEDGLVGRWTADRSAVKAAQFLAQAGAIPGEIIGNVGLSAKPDALSFDGGKGYVRFLEKGEGLPVAALSAEAWVAPRAGGPWGGVFGCLQDNGDFERGWLLGFKDSKWSFAVCAGRKLTYLAAREEMRLNRWTHVVGTYDGSVMRLFVDGREVAQSKEQSGPVAYAPAEFVIGAYKDKDEQYGFNGLLREAALWGRALSADEVARRFAEGSAQFPATMEASPRALSGPWVRFTAPDSALVEWETAGAGEGVVEFGATTALGSTAREEARGAEPVKGPVRHSVLLRGLNRDAVYYYRLRLGDAAFSETWRLETDFNFTRTPLPETEPFPADDLTRKAREIAGTLVSRIKANTGNAGGGYVIDYGCGDGRLAWEIARRLPNYSVLGVSGDAAAIAEGRARLDSAGVYGSRVTLLHCDPKQLPLNDHHFDWVVSSEMLMRQQKVGSPMELLRVMNPGARIEIDPAVGADASPLTNAVWREWWGGLEDRLVSSDAVRNGSKTALLGRELKRPGAPAGAVHWVKKMPEGSGAWSHAYGDAGQSTNSGDSTVKGENLGLRWFGEPGARGMMDRQPRNPPPLCVNGTFYIQGNDRLFALNAWNGAMLWTLEVPGLRRVNLPRDSSNVCADGDHLYAVIRDRALRIRARTGEVTGTFALPDAGRRDWGYIAVVGGQVFGTTVMPASAYTRFEGGEAYWYDTHGPESTAKVLSDSIFALDRTTGRHAWRHHSRGLVINPTISIGGGRVYFVESRGLADTGDADGGKDVATPGGNTPRSSGKSAPWPGRLESPALYKDAWIVALDAASGAVVWERPAGIGALGTAEALYLCYSDEKLVLLDSASKTYHTLAFDAKTGTPIWKRQHPWTRDHHGGHLYHPVIVRGMVIVEPFGYDLASGAVKLRDLPERGGCSTLSAAAECLHFINWDYDKGSMYVWDLDEDRARQFSGSRGSCWLSFISGSGMVLLPAASGGCTCKYPNQVTLGFGPRVEVVK